MQTITENDVDIYDVTKNRTCHLLNLATGMSWCGVKMFTPATLHTMKICRQYHTQCVVCRDLKNANHANSK